MTMIRSEITGDPSWPVDATTRMNRMYRYQRHIYDITRRYYLLGRNELIVGLTPPVGGHVLEIGCGTGRNLVAAALRYPEARFYGFDVSTEMLTSAIGAIARAGVSGRAKVAHGDATNFTAQGVFGQPVAFDRVMISYSLSMIPDWTAVIEHAIASLKPGGQLHIVDFGDQSGLPGFARRALRHWLALFGVTPRDQLEATLMQIAVRTGAGLQFDRPYRGYAQAAVLTLPARRPA
ncbi:methyltransferase [Rhodopseudomonas sp. AAP120]|jgi:S-adenosylmethionine-diacylgycerolhomoserine-N-methlytransferase|uniref:class I SAM-dependent methyltransferase n=1 Tax=Rhodopseudomonas sp. AAP120 TaxID=1523430 RepID=UPI0006B8DA4F|nr:class I SAM-dependent methyltransferase [Rhodopseudomonas sp. AAP120]KPF93111.1 methyltransferase [Rhodopseudomonas sp. AAP120]